jgi:farnesyl-diphosphate farnesyltransferase
MEQNDSPRQAQAWEFSRRILTDVSRSFAIIIPECPPPLDRALCTAYLLCRVADTIEDEPALDEARQGSLFDALLTVVDRPEDKAALDRFLSLWPQMEFSEVGYGELVRGAAHVLEVYRGLPSELSGPIRNCVHEMVAGMRRLRPVETRDGVGFFCRNLPELDRYCHVVAGTVGVMSTAMFEWKLAGHDFVATPGWREQGRRLGLGLQMTNIIKDCRVDAQRGVSFIPSAYIHFSAGLYELAPRLRGEVFSHAIAHLDAGLDYTLNVPPAEAGIRRFLLGSLLPAIATLETAAPGTEFQPKINRPQMMEILELITDQRSTDRALRSWYVHHRTRTLTAAAVSHYPGTTPADSP